MTDSVRKFVARAPRYVLRPQDRTSMRFSLESSSGAGGIEQTTLLNLSETGVAFLVEAGHEPELGEHVKVEVPIPGGDQIAWWATVARIETYEIRGWFYSKDPFEDEGKVLVGLRFDKMPAPHTRAIRQGLRHSFIKTMREQQIRTVQYYHSLFMTNIWKLAFYTALAVGAFALVYWLSRPTENYDSKRGSPWGERFKF